MNKLSRFLFFSVCLLQSLGPKKKKHFTFRVYVLGGSFVPPGNGQLNDIVGMQMTFAARFVSQSDADNVDYYLPVGINP